MSTTFLEKDKKTQFPTDTDLINHDPIFNLFTALRSTQALQAAHELKLFPLLSEQPRTLEAIAQSLKMQPRAAQALLSLCASHGLILLSNEKYHLSEVSKHYLLPESPYYFGQMIDMAIHNPEVGSYDAFKKALLSNNAQVYSEEDLFETNESDKKRTETFTHAMHSKSMTAASIWPTLVDLSTYHTLLDIGGGSGAHAMTAVKQWPTLQAIVYERPLVCKIAEEYIKKANLENRIKTVEGSMWNSTFPEGDLHFYCDVFHDWPSDKCEFLVEKSYQSLPKNGRIIIHELLFNDQKTGPIPTAVYNMIMLLWTQGQQYSGHEIVTMLEKKGFKEIQIIPTGFGCWSMVTGVK